MNAKLLADGTEQSAGNSGRKTLTLRWREEKGLHLGIQPFGRIPLVTMLVKRILGSFTINGDA